MKHIGRQREPKLTFQRNSFQMSHFVSYFHLTMIHFPISTLPNLAFSLHVAAL
jgi:hypothetical protein